eukprot:1918738-Pyramimonas_sp.AAC.1
MFEITETESDVSDKPAQPIEHIDCTDVASIAVAELKDNISKQLIDQPTEDPAGCNVERVVIEYCCGPDSKTGGPSNFVGNSRRVM